MKTKNKNPYEIIKKKKIDPIISLYFQFNHLKQLYRQGWLRRGLSPEKCESVADHLFAVNLLTIFIAKKYHPSYDIEKLIEMSLIHELGEIYIGDLTPFDGITRERKHVLEKQAIEKVFASFSQKQKYLTLWEEYEDGSSKEARLLRQIDLLEAAFQATIYQIQYKNKEMEDFIPWTKKRLSDKNLAKLLAEIEQIAKNAIQT